MHITFTKGAGKFDRMDIERADGSRESIDCPKQRIVPHDMVHYAVESTLRERGFMTRVKEGEAANFRMSAEPVADAVERLVEVIQGDAWSGGATPAQDMLDLYRVTCDARACPCLPISAQDVDVIRALMRSLDAEWHALPVGGAMTLML